MGNAAHRLEAAETPERFFSIGQVLEALNQDFQDLSLSKLRFLEEQGLVTPQRTPAGYRRFTQDDIERLRMILTLQRDHFLPLKVIAELLTEVDAGGDPPIPGSSQRSFSSILRPSRVLRRDELARSTGVTTRFLSEAVSAGLLPAAEVYPQECVGLVRSLSELAERGITPRHLRSIRTAAERDADLALQVAVSRGQKANSPAARESALEIAGLLEVVRGSVTRTAIHTAGSR